MGNLPAENFARWLRPSEAVGRVPVGSTIEAKRAWIIRRLASGDIRAVAGKAIIKDRHGARRPTFATIGPHVWSYPWHGVHDDFWDTGDASLSNSEQMIGAILISADDPPDRFTRGDTAEFFDVRFDPAAFEFEPSRQLEDTLIQPDNGSPGKPIAPTEMKRFVRLYLEIWGGGATEARALAAIRAAYPENGISRTAFREIFRELRGPGKVGKPSKNNG